MKLIDSRNKQIAPLGTLKRILKNDFIEDVSKAEIWGVALATVAVGVGGAVMSSQAQKNAASTAAGAQLTANQENNNLAAGVYNANAGLSSTSRALGGLAQQQLAYDLGLSPDLNISSTQVTPNIDSSGNVTYKDANGNPVGGGSSGTGAPTAAVKPQFDPVTQSWITPTNNGAYGQTVYTGTGGGAAPTAGGTPAGAPATSNTQPVAPGTAQTQQVNPFRGGTPPTGSTGVVGPSASGPGASVGVGSSPAAPGTVPGPSNNPGTGAGPNTNGTPYGGLSNPYNPSTFFLSPDYQFNLDQGTKALQRANAASGNSASGAALKDAMTFAEGLSSQDYGNAFNRSLASNAQTYNMLQGAVSGGMVGNSATQSAGNTVGSQMTNNNTNTGNAIANQAITTGNANSNMYNNITGTGINALSKYGTSSSSNGGNPYNLGGSTPVAPAGSQLTYDESGNITGSMPIPN